VDEAQIAKRNFLEPCYLCEKQKDVDCNRCGKPVCGDCCGRRTIAILNEYGAHTGNYVIWCKTCQAEDIFTNEQKMRLIITKDVLR
jgi:hypothetical protein